MTTSRSNVTQTDLVLDYLNRYGTITPLEAMRELGCFRLAARIYDIEQRGYVVPRRTVKTTGKKTGRIVRFTEYGTPRKNNGVLQRV
jgi:hypothetical protein